MSAITDKTNVTKQAVWEALRKRRRTRLLKQRLIRLCTTTEFMALDLAALGAAARTAALSADELKRKLPNDTTSSDDNK